MTAAIRLCMNHISYYGRTVVSLILIILFNTMKIDASSSTGDVDYSKLSIKTLSAKANKNDAIAQYEYGLRYLVGKGVTKNEDKAVELLKESAANNYPKALGKLGFIYLHNNKKEESSYYFRKGASLNDGESYYGLYLLNDDNPATKEIAFEMLKKAANLRYEHAFFILAVAYRYKSPADNKEAIYWGKKDCDKSYAEYLESGIMPREGDGWPYLIKWLKELGCDYEPALHVDEYKAWLADKPTPKVPKQQSSTTYSSSPANTTAPAAPTTYHYTKSGRGQSQNTGQWTDGGSEECNVEFYDDYITVNGNVYSFVKNSGTWKLYGGTSMGFGSCNSTDYYYVDANKNMKYVSEFASPYGFDTFVYPMSMNGDPTPHNVSQSNYTNNSSSGNSNSTNSSTQSTTKFKCAYCKDGWIEKNDNASATYGINKPKKKCTICGIWYDPNVRIHYHVQCSHCGGSGYAK